MDTWEMVVLAHLGLFLIAAAWAFGGEATWARILLSCWGSLGAALTVIFALRSKRTEAAADRQPLRWLWPLGLFNVLVLVSCLTPNLQHVKFGDEPLLVPQAVPAWKPSCAMPAEALRKLWLFDGIYLSCLNLALAVRRRRALRLLLFVACGNAVALAVFGTLQKLAHAGGLFFGLVPTRQIYFFASFIYHNHWGAFVILMTAACLGLIRHYARRHHKHDFFHSPAFGGFVAVFLLAATVPLSGSRSGTVLLLILLAGWLGESLVRSIKKKRELGEPIAPALAKAAFLTLVVLCGIWLIAGDAIAQRAAKTEEQVVAMRAQGGIGSRALLYRNTLRMASDKPIFGWGLDSYATVFMLYNTQTSVDGLPVFYADAHCDWLQSLAETGVVGTMLIGLCALLPLRTLRRCDLSGSVPRSLLAGCALILLYAWIEFPFGNTAVVLTWWACLFCAVHYARLSRSSSQPEPIKAAAISA